MAFREREGSSASINRGRRLSYCVGPWKEKVNKSVYTLAMLGSAKDDSQRPIVRRVKGRRWKDRNNVASVHFEGIGSHNIFESVFVIVLEANRPSENNSIFHILWGCRSGMIWNFAVAHFWISR